IEQPLALLDSVPIVDEKGEGLFYMPERLALLFLVEREVDQSRRRPMIAIDAGRPHHELITGWRDLPKDTREPWTLNGKDGRYELLAPGRAVQLTLDMPEARVT